MIVTVEQVKHKERLLAEKAQYILEHKQDLQTLEDATRESKGDFKIDRL